MGLVPPWSKDRPTTKHPINARAETVATSGMFRGAFAQRRCLVPADAFYERKVTEGEKQPYAIARLDRQPMAFCRLVGGLLLARWHRAADVRHHHHQRERGYDGLHDRMPVILDQADWPASLGEAEGDRTALLRPASDGAERSKNV